MATNFRQIGMAAATFSVALGIGFVMQNGDALASRFGSDSAIPEPAPFTADESQQAFGQDTGDASPDLPALFGQEPSAQSQELSMSGQERVANAGAVLPEVMQVQPQPDSDLRLAAIEQDVLPFSQEETRVRPLDCVPTIDGVAGSAATIKVTVVAPCHMNSSFTTHHQGMMFTTRTDNDGRATFTMPALAEVAVIIVAFENGDGAVLTTSVPEFENFDRAVLQWQGNASVMLSAYEGGAGFGDAGHIYSGNTGSFARIENEQGGYLIQLGDASIDNGLMAEVYISPTSSTVGSTDVVLVAEAEITPANCGQDISAQSLQVDPSGATSALDMTIKMPDCDVVGDVLILQNMFKDLTLAAR